MRMSHASTRLVHDVQVPVSHADGGQRKRSDGNLGCAIIGLQTRCRLAPIPHQRLPAGERRQGRGIGRGAPERAMATSASTVSKVSTTSPCRLTKARCRPKPASPNSAAAMPAPAIAASKLDLAPRQMLRTPLFWLMFVMMTMMSTSGLMVTSQMATFARDFGVANVMVFGLAALGPMFQHMFPGGQPIAAPRFFRPV